MTEASKEAYIPSATEETFPLKCVPCINHLVQFKKNQAEVQAILDSGSEVNIMTLAYAAKLDLKIRPISIRVQKINSSTLQTFGIVLANFQVNNKFGRVCFFQKTFLLVAISIEVILGIPFLTFSNVDM